MDGKAIDIACLSLYTDVDLNRIAFERAQAPISAQLAPYGQRWWPQHLYDPSASL